MKKLPIVCAALALVLTTSAVEAKERGSKSSNHENSISTTQAAPARTGTTAVEMRLGVGYTTINNGASVWIELNENHSLQGMLAFNSTSPFNFGFGTLYRMNLTGSQANGFHAGGGFDLGTTGATEAFFINIRPLAGFHFAWPGFDHVLLSVDGGPNFQILNGNFNFIFGPATSALVGMSVHYLL